MSWQSVICLACVVRKITFLVKERKETSQNPCVKKRSWTKLSHSCELLWAHTAAKWGQDWEKFQLVKKTWFFGDWILSTTCRARQSGQPKRGFVTQRPDGELWAKWLFIVNTVMYIYPPSPILFLWIDGSWLWSAEFHFGVCLEGTHHSWSPEKMNSLIWAAKNYCSSHFLQSLRESCERFWAALAPRLWLV